MTLCPTCRQPVVVHWRDGYNPATLDALRELVELVEAIGTGQPWRAYRVALRRARELLEEV